MLPSLDVLVQNNKRHLASFYTPPRVAQVLTDWAITSPNTTVLDPSFGGCAFLCAALETLGQQGNSLPGGQVYGVDIDPNALSYLQPLFAAGAKPEHFITTDFFNIAPYHFRRELFGAVVGNPPYIRYHDIPDEAQQLAVACLKNFDIEISGRGSYWAFFLLYSMQFLCQGGRLAMILPGAILHTDYSIKVRELLVQYFAEVTIFLLQERIFDDTEEESVLVCAAGAREPHRSLRIGAVNRVEDLENAFENIQTSTRQIDSDEGDGGWLRALIEPETITIYDQLIQSTNIIRLGEWARVHIGVVTGDNKYFILSRAEQEQRSIPSNYLTPIIRRPTYLTGLWATDQDLNDLATNGNKSLLLTIDQTDLTLSPSLQDYICYGQQIGTPNARKCKDRRVWYIVPSTFIPPAFVACMSAAWPRLVINQSGYTCTNNILRLLWKEDRPIEDWTRLALGILSTLSQLSAELVGRSYGGGVLKLEPKELVRLVIPLVPVETINSLAPKIDLLLRQKKLHEATNAVDAVLLKCGLGLTIDRLNKLRAARDYLFLRRRQHRRDAQEILEIKI